MHTESQLVIPAISVIRAHGGICDTSDLLLDLKNTLPLDEEDLQVLPSASFIRIDQIIRNLKSNKHLLRMGLVEHYKGGFMLTEKGLALGMEELEGLVVKYFSPRPNTLSVQQCMVKYVDEIAKIKFVSRRDAANTIRKEFASLPTFKCDDDRMTAVGQLVDDYVQSHPENVK